MENPPIFGGGFRLQNRCVQHQGQHAPDRRRRQYGGLRTPAGVGVTTGSDFPKETVLALQWGRLRHPDKRGCHACRAILAGSLALLPDMAVAQQLQGCEDHRDMVRRLEAKYHEQRAEVGTNQYGWLIELFESADGETWTLVATRPGGPACVFGVGDHWQSVTPVKGVPSALRY